MRTLLMVRYGEIFLKGLNRGSFMRALVDRVREAAEPLGGRVSLRDSRLFVEGCPDMDACVERVRRVFGVHSLCVAYELDKDDFDALCQTALRVMDGLKGTFKVMARRSDKRYFLDSPAINARVGEYVLTHSDLTVDVRHPDHELSIEIRDMAYVYARVLPGAGGMPVGTGGKATLLLSGGIDSPVAGYMIAKRGVQVSAVHFMSPPYTSERAREKVIELARRLAPSLCGVTLYLVPFTELQMKIHEKCLPDYTTLIMRRCMMRIAQAIAQREGAKALITGESLGQVASQTMDALAMTNAVCQMPVFRPLIGFDKIDIIRIAEQIGTYETSVLPYEDCCTVFTPRHPATHPKIEKILECERALDGDELIAQALERVEVTHLSVHASA